MGGKPGDARFCLYFLGLVIDGRGVFRVLVSDAWGPLGGGSFWAGQGDVDRRPPPLSLSYHGCMAESYGTRAPSSPPSVGCEATALTRNMPGKNGEKRPTGGYQNWYPKTGRKLP